jgi:hypothetical protein
MRILFSFRESSCLEFDDECENDDEHAVPGD